MIRFVNPYLLLALAGAAIPIVIHLLTRDRVRKVAFSSLRFFAQASRTVLRRKRFAEMVLIAMRVLACALLAIIFARPLFTDEGDAAGGPNGVTVIVVDASASMAQSFDDDHLQGAVLDAIDNLRRGEQGAIVAFDRMPTVVAPLTANQDDLRMAAANVHIGHGGTDIAGALDKARQLLSASVAPLKRVVLISDLQRVGWESFNGTWRLPPGVELAITPVAPREGAPNLAIVGSQTPQGVILDHQPRHITVRVANFGADEAKDVQVALDVNGNTVDTQRITVPAGRSVATRFAHVFNQPGDNRGIVRVESNDAAPDDNVLYFNARVIPRIPILVIGGAPGSASNTAFFVSAALAPSEQSPFTAKRIAAGAATVADIEAASVVIIADVGMLPSKLHAPLKALLERGGGLLLMPGANAQPETFAASFADVSPCKLRRVIAQPITQTAGLTRIDYGHPVFEVFLRPHHGDFSSVDVERYWEVIDSQLSTVLARFDDGRPAILERQIGSGLSMIWLTPVDPDWNNLPMRAIYLPLLHQCVRRLAVQTESQTAYTVGDVLPVIEDCELTGPTGEKLGTESLAAAMPGFHEMTAPNGAKFVFAVNRPLDEADIAPVNEREISAALEQPEQPGEKATAASLMNDGKLDDQGLWWYVLAVLMVLLIGELYLGNQTARH